MPKTKKDSQTFQVFEWPFPYRNEALKFIAIESKRIRQCMKHFRDAHLDGIYISKAHGYALNDLSFLKDYPDVRRLELRYASGISLSDLCAVPALHSITIGENTEPIDYSPFLELEDLNIDWHPRVTFPKVNKTLKSLFLSDYKPRSRDLTELPEFVNMERFHLIRAPLHSLAGLGRFKRLKFLKICRLSKLERIADLDAYSLEELQLQVCRKIADHEHVTNFPRLWRLMLSDCGSVPSLKFLDRMPKLRWFTFVDTNIIDGDMTPCFRLETVGTLNKKHYSHTCEEIKAIIAKRRKKS
jgi:protein phosphatase 1 regulatory subunit 7